MSSSSSKIAPLAGNATESSARQRSDSFSPLHLIVQTALAVLICSGSELDRIFNLWLALVPVLGIPFIIVALFWLVSVGWNLYQRRWRRLASALIAPPVVIGVTALLLYHEIDAQWVRFQFNRSSYQRTVEGLSGPHPRSHKWSWGDTGGAAVANVFRTLEYDESDRVPLTLERPDPERTSNTVTVRSFGSHFYLVTRIYQ